MSEGDVILEADGKPLKSLDDLQHLLQDKKVGDNVELSIGRENRKGRVQVVLEEAPS